MDSFFIAPVFNTPILQKTEFKPVIIGRNSTLPEWTPNFNGVNSYLLIPEWIPTGLFEIECDIYLAGTSYWQYFTSTKYRNFSISCGAKYAYGGSIQLATLFIDGVVVEPQTDTTKGFHTLKFTGNYVLENGFTVFGARVNNSNDGYMDHLKGQISSLKLTDLENPANSRHYKSVIKSSSMPTTTVLKDELGDGSTDAQMYNFGATAPWVPFLTSGRDVYLGQYWDNGVFIRSNGTTVTLTSHQGTGAKGSWDSNSYMNPVDTLFVAKNGAICKLLSHGNDITVECLRIVGADDEINEGFGYPAVFQAVHPTDPDYGDYL